MLNSSSAKPHTSSTNRDGITPTREGGGGVNRNGARMSKCHVDECLGKRSPGSGGNRASGICSKGHLNTNQTSEDTKRWSGTRGGQGGRKGDRGRRTRRQQSVPVRDWAAGKGWHGGEGAGVRLIEAGRGR